MLFSRFAIVLALALALTLFPSPAAHARDLEINAKTKVSFADAKKAGEILTAKDEFVAALSPFDRSVRMKTDKAVSEEEFLSFLGENTLDWREGERNRITDLIESLKPKLESYALDLPETIWMVKITNDLGGAPHTRQNAVILPEIVLADPSDNLKHTIPHELFHVFTRHQPKARDSFYGIIGFKPCGDVPFPEELAPIKCTNPDAPFNRHYIEVTFRGKKMKAMPILFANKPHYDKERGGTLFDYLEFKLLALEEKEGKWTPRYRDGRPFLVDLMEVSGFFEQTGRNTLYIIHPEEILAVNFDFLVNGKKNLPTPRILEEMQKLLEKGE